MGCVARHRHKGQRPLPAPGDRHQPVRCPNGAYIEDSEGYSVLGAWWKTQGSELLLGWGFRTLADYDHFSITPDGVHK